MKKKFDLAQGYWRCKQHKENCKSYVLGLVDELNKGNEPTKEDLKLVEFVKTDKCW